MKGEDQQAGIPEATASALKRLTLEELSRIEVTTVSKESTEAFKTPAAIFVLTREDIARSGATVLPELLRLVPGVEVAQISSDKWAIGIRGFQGYLSKSVLVLIDGRSVYAPLFAGVYWEMQDTLIEDIDRIEVIRGPGGTIWGANAVNGVINIITKSARETRGSLVSLAGGNVEQGFVGVRYGAGDNRLAYRVWGKGFTRGPFYHQDKQNFDDWRRGQTGFRLDWNPGTRDSLTISGSAYAMRVGSRLAISTYSPPALNDVQANGEFSGQHLVAAWRRTLPSGSDLQIRAFYDRTDRRDLNYREVRNTFDFDFLHHLSAGTHNVLWGGGVHISPSHFVQTVPAVAFTPAKNTHTIYSGFVQDSISLVPNRLTAVLGTKLERNSYSGVEVQPSGRLAWTPNEQNTVWISLTRAVRTPSRLEEGFEYSALIAPGPLFVRLIGDGGFDSEQLVGYEYGYRAYVKRAGFVNFNGFYNRYSNLLSVESQTPVVEAVPAPLHLVIPLHLRNGIAARTAGFEVSTLWDISAWWRLKGSYSLLHLAAERDRTSNDVSTVNQLEGDSPSHKVVVRSFLTLPRGFELDLGYRYVSSVPDQKVPGYSTGDARLARRITREIELSVVAQSLFQPRHLEYAGLPGSPAEVRRSAYLRLLWTR
jgi:iron complex outermembrane recepter protein